MRKVIVDLTREYKILIIDDGVKNADIYKIILENEGYTVDTVTNGREAIIQSENNPYDLALINYRLPDMDGTELLFKLQDNIPPMIKILITDFPSLENTLKTLNNGADGYIVKPVNIDELLLKVSENLKRRLMNQQVTEDRVTEFAETKARKVNLRHIFRENC